MSRIFGDVRQNGYVVPDIEAALDHWTRVTRRAGWCRAAGHPESLSRPISLRGCRAGNGGRSGSSGTCVELAIIDSMV